MSFQLGGRDATGSPPADRTLNVQVNAPIGSRGLAPTTRGRHLEADRSTHRHPRRATRNSSQAPRRRPRPSCRSPPPATSTPGHSNDGSDPEATSLTADPGLSAEAAAHAAHRRARASIDQALGEADRGVLPQRNHSVSGALHRPRALLPHPRRPHTSRHAAPRHSGSTQHRRGGVLRHCSKVRSLRRTAGARPRPGSSRAPGGPPGCARRARGARARPSALPRCT